MRANDDALRDGGPGIRVGLQQVRLGNLGVFARTEEQWGALLEAVGQEAIG